jgi:multidrug efflux pump subunit AcrA (membrane-fusion protein)
MIILALGAFGLWPFLTNTPSVAALDATVEKIPVKVAPVVRRNLSSMHSALGTVNYLTKADVSSEIDGILNSVNLQEGDLVEKGQVIAVIDTQLLEARLKEARAVLELEELNLPKWKNEIKKGELKVEKNRIAVRNYGELYDAQKKLFKTGSISRARINRAEIDYQDALLAYKSAIEDLNSLKTKSKQGRSEVEARIAKARADIEEIQTKLAKCTIKSPITGVVAVKRKWTGEKTSSRDSVIVTILGIDAVYAEVEISEKKVAKLKVGQEADVRADAYPGMTFAGKIQSISPTVEPNSRTVRVKIKVPNQKRFLKPGMFVRVNIFLDKRADALVVPLEALLKTKDGRNIVFVVVDEVAFLREVQTAGRKENWVIVKTGVKSGENVVIEGQKQLKDLSSVEIMESGTQ